MNMPQVDATPIVLPVLLENIADAICNRPAESAAQRVSRRREIAELAQGFLPNDAVEMMLVSMVIAHAHLLEDATCDVFRGRDDRVKAQTKSQIVALDRGMLGYLKELRTLQDRRRKAEAVAGKIAGVAAGAGAVVTQVKAQAAMTHPVTRDTTHNKPTPATVPMPPVALLPSLRGSEISTAAMLAILAPSTGPVVASHAPLRSGGLPASGRVASTSKISVDGVDARAA
jgi:hypothetical protein